MTDEERIKELIKEFEEYDYPDYYYSDVKMLINRVKELEGEVESIKKLDVLVEEYAAVYDHTKLKAENARYRKALEFYADKSNHRKARGDGYESEVFLDGGDRAIKALKGEEN